MSARNVFNVDAVDRFVSDVAAAASPAVAQWLHRTGRRWIIGQLNRYFRLEVGGGSSAVLLVDPAGPADQPRRLLASSVASLQPWCRTALAAGQDVIYLRLDATLEKRLRRIVAYLEETYGAAEADRLNRLSFPDAERAMRVSRRRRWQLQSRHAVAEPVYRGQDGVRIVKLRTAASLADEGARMAHCVGSYAKDVSEGQCEIYSLRDGGDESRATIEVADGKCVLQVKGKANGRVDRAVRPHLRSFIRSRRYRIDADFMDLVNVALPLSPCRTVAELDDHLRTAQGRRDVAAFVFPRNNGLVRADTLALILMIRGLAPKLSPESLRVIHDALLPKDGNPVRLRRVGTFFVYDLAVPMMRVDAAVAWLSLAASGAFDSLPGVRGRLTLLRELAEQRVASLCFSAPDRLHLLGPVGGHELGDDVRWLSAADLLRDSRLDIFPSVRRRHEEFRRRLNRRKARAAGRRAEPSDAHQAFRDLLDGHWQEMVV